MAFRLTNTRAQAISILVFQGGEQRQIMLTSNNPTLVDDVAQGQNLGFHGIKIEEVAATAPAPTPAIVAPASDTSPGDSTAPVTRSGRR